MNTSLHEKSGKMISAPPDQPDQAQQTIPHSLSAECSRVLKGIYGKDLDGINFDSFRICWYKQLHATHTPLLLTLVSRDGLTPNQDFIISSHPNCKNLYIATGGSFHGWKFLPIIGQYVVKMLDGELDDDLLKRWAWDRPQDGGAHETIRPRRELRDLL
jgi:sarcosine oxidase/L-pipecolate oxidase